MLQLDKNNIEDIFPMSDIQQGMLFHSFKDDSFATYHDQNLFNLTDDNFNIEVFKTAINLLIEKHAVLRTVFNLVDFKNPVQFVLKKINPNLEFIDITDSSDKKEKYERVKGILEEDRNNPFDLKKYTTLWRIKIVKLSETEICLLWIFHHAVFDGWSTSSFITELHNVYKKLKLESNFKPKALKSTYKEYVIEQMAYKESEELKDFWKKELSDYKRYTLKNKIEDSDLQDVGFFTELLDKSLLEQIRNQSKINEIPVKTYCLVAYLYTLKLFTYDDDILIGLMSNNRPLCDDSDKILGCFLNAIPFRIKIPAKGTWLELLQLVNKKQIELTAYDKLSFFEIVKTCKEETNDQNPFFDAAFDFLDFHIYNNLDGNTSGENQYLESLNFEKTNALLDFDVSTTMGQFRFNITYATPLFDEEKINRMAYYYKQVLYKLAYEVSIEIKNEEILNPKEKQQLFNQFNKEASTIFKENTFIKLFENQVEKTPNNIAVNDSLVQLSYKELNKNANQIASLLKDIDVKPEGVVLLYFNRNSFLLASIIGVLKSGASFVAIDTETPIERIKFIVEDSQSKVILTQTFLEDKIKETISVGSGIEVIPVADKDKLHSKVQEKQFENIEKSIEANDLAYIIYTSGTTGVPKGVMLHHHGLSNHLLSVVDFLKINQNDVMAQTASCNFDVSIMQFLLCLIVGGKTEVIEKNIQLEPNLFLQKLKDTKTTLLELVPSHIESILDTIQNVEDYFPKLRYFISTGEVLPERLVKKWYNQINDTPIINAYGPAETSDDVTLYIVDKDDENPIPVGRPLQNVSLNIVDQYNQLCPIGVVGEITIGGVAVGKGYWNNKELTNKSFIKNPFLKDSQNKNHSILYKTGDLGYWSEEGNLIVKGRVGSMVKIRGNRIELGEVESHINKVGKIEMAVVQDKEINNERVLCVYYKSDKTITTEEIRNALSETLPKYMLPTYYIQVEAFPLSQNGKILRDKLPIPDLKSKQSSIIDKENLSEAEQLILSIWKEVLNIDSVGLNDNFFDVGGHSLNLIKINTKLNEVLEEPITIVTLFQYPTISTLANFIQKEKVTELISEESIEESVELMDDAMSFFSED